MVDVSVLNLRREDFLTEEERLPGRDADLDIRRR